MAKPRSIAGEVASGMAVEASLGQAQRSLAGGGRVPGVLRDAFNRAKSTDADKVVKALLETNIPGDQILNPWKGVQFDPTSHQNIHASAMLHVAGVLGTKGSAGEVDAKVACETDMQVEGKFPIKVGRINLDLCEADELVD